MPGDPIGAPPEPRVPRDGSFQYSVCCRDCGAVADIPSLSSLPQGWSCVGLDVVCSFCLPVSGRETQDERPGHDPVNHPRHYVLPGGLECADVIEALGMDRNWYFGNAFKYLWRAGRKGDAVEDIRKAIWYLTRWANREEAESK